jgi:hypothetical protein
MNKVICGIRTSLCNTQKMMCIQCFSIEQVFVANWTMPILVHCYFVELRSLVPIGLAISGLTLFPVMF